MIRFGRSLDTPGPQQSQFLIGHFHITFMRHDALSKVDARQTMWPSAICILTSKGHVIHLKWDLGLSRFFFPDLGKHKCGFFPHLFSFPSPDMSLSASFTDGVVNEVEETAKKKTKNHESKKNGEPTGREERNLSTQSFGGLTRSIFSVAT